MNCEKVRYLLDLYIDDEITRADAYEVSQHAKVCPACAREIQAAKLMRKAIRDMDDNIDVPLKARAAWRNAVREEARKRKSRVVLRAIYGVAAALVLVVGATVAMQGKDAAPLLQSAPAAVSEPVAVRELVARDGMIQQESMEWQSGETYSAWKKITTDQPDRASATLESLAQEYSGSLTMLEDGVCRIEIPAAYLEEFMGAASRIGTEVDSQTVDVEGETAVIYIQICEE